MAAPSLRRRLVTRRTPAGHARRIVTARATKQLTAFLAAQARLNRHWLRTSMPAGPRPRDVIDQLSIERGREIEFQRRSVSRLSRDLPEALAMPARSRRAQAARAREVRRILDTERRYAKLHTRELARRSLASVTRARLRTESPEGAFWQLGHAKQHTGGCLIMAGHFWPWVVLDRVHPPRHAGCTSSLYSKAEAVARGWMAEGDVPSDADAIHRAGSVMMEGERDALLRELAVRDRLVELGADREALAEIPWMGVLSEAFSPELHPRDWRGRWRRKLGLKRIELKGEKRLSETQVRSKVQRIADALTDFYGGEKVTAVHEPEYLATVGSDARFRHEGETLPGLLYGTRIMDRARDPELGVADLRIVAHEAAHSLSGTRPGPLPGFSQAVEEGSAEILSLWFWHHRMQAFDHRDAVKAGGKWTEGLDSLAHNVAYREHVEEMMRRAASRVGWDRGKIIDEIEGVMRGDHAARLKFRDSTDPGFQLPHDLPEMPRSSGAMGESDRAVPLIRWLVGAPGTSRLTDLQHELLTHIGRLTRLKLTAAEKPHVTTRELSQATGRFGQVVGHSAGAMVDRGLLERVGPATYKLTRAGLDALEKEHKLGEEAAGGTTAEV